MKAIPLAVLTLAVLALAVLAVGGVNAHDGDHDDRMDGTIERCSAMMGSMAEMSDEETEENGPMNTPPAQDHGGDEHGHDGKMGCC